MVENKLEFIINKDSIDKKVELESMSLEAADAFSTLLNSMIKIVRLNVDNEGLTIQIKSGSAVLIAEGTEAQIEEIQENFNEIINFKSANKELVNEWRNIQKLFKANGLNYEAHIYAKGTKISILKSLKTHKLLRSKPVTKPFTPTIRFMSGKLIAVGGNNPNLHLEDEPGARVKIINCTEERAKKANRFLYEKAFISCWVKIGVEDERLELCDSYFQESDFNMLNAFITDFLSTSSEIKQLKMLHYKCRDFLDVQDYGGFRRFIRLFNHESTDVNILKTILIITQSFKEHENLKDLRKEIKDIFDKKMKEYKRVKSKNK